MDELFSPRSSASFWARQPIFWLWQLNF